MPTIFLNEAGVVMAVFLKPADAIEYATISKHKYTATQFNVANSGNVPLPQVGSVHKA